jgi:RIO kinase 1
MRTKHNFDLYEQLEDLEGLPPIRNVPNQQLRGRTTPNKPAGQMPPDIISHLAEEEDEFCFSYGAAKHEKQWLTDSLQDFHRQGWFDDILRLIKGGGKEASVYQCLSSDTAGEQYLAAKVYRPRKFRQLRNDSLYREGRPHLDDEGHEIHDGRALHAIHNRTKFGMQLLHTSWIEHEFQTMRLLCEAGADVPQPFVSSNNAILMSYIGWDDAPAPTLNTIRLERQELQAVFDSVIKNVEIMLDKHCVHGDLSAYNILYFEGKIFLIDFPQAVNPEENRNAYAIFQRDILRLFEFFQERGMDCNPKAWAKKLWLRHGYAIRPSVHPSLLEPEVLETDQFR